MIKAIIADEDRLKRKSIDIDLNPIKSEVMPMTVQQVADDLMDTAEAHRDSKVGCAGLAANQIGYCVRVFVIKLDYYYEPIINPKVIKRGGRLIKGGENCLSRPGKPVIDKVRYQRITIEYVDMDGATKRETFHNFNARVVQHEMDHFDGILI